MEVIYSVGAQVPGGGIGNLSYQALKALVSKGYLKKGILQKNNARLPKELIKEIRWTGVIPNYYWKDMIFDFLASRFVEKSDIFHGWNNMSLQGLRVAKREGAIGIIERASSHILSQNELLKEEYSLFKVNYQPVDSRTIKRCLAEYEEADFVFVPSEFAYESFIKNGYPDKKLRVMKFGVDLDKFTPRSKEKEKFRVVFVGQVGLRKGVQYLLQAWAELKLKEVELLIVGPVFPDFKEVYLKYKDLPNTSFINYSKETEKIYQSSSIFVFPTIEEGTALAVLDALASGLPVVTTPNAGSPVKDGEEGFLVPIRDIKKLKEKILELYKDQMLLAKMGRNARKRVEDYSWGNYQDNLIKTYESIK